MAINFTDSPESIIAALISAQPGNEQITPALVTFGAAVVDSSTAKNTKVVVTAVNGSGYKDARDIFYDRVALSSVPGSRSTEFNQGAATSLAGLITAINTRYGINLTAADYVDAPIPSFPGAGPGETQDVVLAAKAGSLVWRGSLTISVRENDVSLTVAIPNNVLDGLVYTPPA